MTFTACFSCASTRRIRQSLSRTLSQPTPKEAQLRRSVALSRRPMAFSAGAHMHITRPLAAL